MYWKTLERNHRFLLYTGLCSHRLIRVSLLTFVHCQNHLQKAYEHQHWTMEQWKRWPGLINHVFFFIMWMARCVCVAYLGKRWQQDTLWEEGKSVEAV